MSEEESTNNLPSADVLFDSSANYIDDYDYERNDYLKFYVSDNYKISN